MKIRIIPDLANEIYHERDGYLSSSVIKAALEGTVAYDNYLNAEKKKDSDDLIMGTLSHTCLLENSRFEGSYIEYDEDARPEPDKTFSSTANKNWKASLETEALINKLPLVKKSIVDEVKAMREVAMTYKSVTDMLEKSTFELSIFVDDFEVEGIGKFNIKIRPDVLYTTGFEDYKTARDASEQGFKNAIEDRHYDLSIALYYDVLMKMKQFKHLDKLDVFWLVQDKTGTRNIMRYDATDYLELGRMKYRKALEIIKMYNAGQLWTTMDDLNGGYAKRISPSKWTMDKYNME